MEWWWWTTYLFAYCAIFFQCYYHIAPGMMFLKYTFDIQWIPTVVRVKFPFFSLVTRTFILEYSPSSSHSIPIPGTLNPKQLAVLQICHVFICLSFILWNALHFLSYFNNSNVHLSGFNSNLSKSRRPSWPQSPFSSFTYPMMHISIITYVILIIHCILLYLPTCPTKV